MAFITFPNERTRTIQRDRSAATRITQTAESGASVVTPSAVTFAFVNGAGTVLSSGSATVAADGSAYYDLPAAATDGVDYGADYEERWVFTIDGVAYPFRRDAAVVHSLIHPVVTDSQVVRGHPELTQVRAASETSWEDEREEAWTEIEAWLQESGRRPWLIMSSRVLYRLHLAWTRYVIYRGLASGPRGNLGAYADTRDLYKDEYERLRDGLNLEAYDFRETGNAEDAVEDVAVKGNIWLGAAPPRRYGW